MARIGDLPGKAPSPRRAARREARQVVWRYKQEPSVVEEHRPAKKCEFMVCNGTTDTLLDDYEQGRPTGLALRNFWDSVLEYIGGQYEDDMSKATIPQMRATSMVMLLSL